MDDAKKRMQQKKTQKQNDDGDVWKKNEKDHITGFYRMFPDIVVAPLHGQDRANIVEVTTLNSTNMSYMPKEDPIQFVEDKKRKKYKPLEEQLDAKGHKKINNVLYFTQDVWGAGGRDNQTIINKFTLLQQAKKGTPFKQNVDRINRNLGFGVLNAIMNSIHRAGRIWQEKSEPRKAKRSRSEAFDPICEEEEEEKENLVCQPNKKKQQLTNRDKGDGYQSSS